MTHESYVHVIIATFTISDEIHLANTLTTIYNNNAKEKHYINKHNNI